MRNVVLYIATTLDGYIAGPSGEIDWLFHDQDYGYTEFLSSVDTLIMGRRTYKVTRSFGPWPNGDRKTFVFSRSQQPVTDENIVFVTPDVPQFINDLKQKPEKEVWLVGGREVVDEFVRHDLIDEFRIFVHPVLLGDGIGLFRPPFDRRALKLDRVTQFDSELVEMAYSRDLG